MPNVENWSTQRLLSTAARLVEHKVNQELAALEVTHAGMLVLKVLYDRGTTTQVDLAKALHVQRQTVGKTLERLEAAGYIERNRPDTDRRSLVVTITSSGRAVLRGVERTDHHLGLESREEHLELRALLQNVITALAIDPPGSEGPPLNVFPIKGP